MISNRGHQTRAVVVDNSSGEEDLQLLAGLQSEFPEEVEIIKSTENLGYFPGLNVGIKALHQRFGEFDAVVVGNNDLLFANDFIDSLARYESLLVGYPVISPDVVTIDGTHQNPHVIESISKSRELLYDLYYSNYYLARLLIWLARVTRPISRRKDDLQWAVSRPILQGHGSCYILSPLFFRLFDALWAPTFLMGEEFFLSKQLRDGGHQVYYESRVRVLHCLHATISRVPARRIWTYSRLAHRLYRQHVKIF